MIRKSFLRRVGICTIWGLCMLSCSTKEKHFTYTIPNLEAEELQYVADTNKLEYTMFCTYSYYCDFCREEFPKVFQFCDSLPMNFYVLFHVRTTDSTYIYTCMKEIQKLDSSFNNFVILSDSLYDEQYRHVEQKGLFRHYGGTIEGNKFINYIDNYIPKRFSHEYSTPKLILYKKGEGIVFVNRFEIDGEETSLSNADKWELEDIIYRKQKN